jgi:hypothetical protein
VTGVDFAAAALAKAPARMGTFDLLVDYGTFDDRGNAEQRRYVESVSTRARTGTEFLLWCFESPPRRRNRWLGVRRVAPSEIAARFGSRWEVERLAGTGPDLRKVHRRTACYLMRYRC